MAKTVIVHIFNEDPMLADMEELPDPTAMYVSFSNLRKRDGKPINYISPGAKTILFPWSRIAFLEIMVSAEERRGVVDFYRES